MVIDGEDLAKAKPEHVLRLAKALHIQTEGRTHAEICRAILHWVKRNPQPKRKNR